MYRVLVAVLLATTVAGNNEVLPPRVTKDHYPLSPQGRIVGGWNATIEDYPWQVSLQVLGFHFCGGSIISEKIILTAGHCMAYPVGWISARVGSSELGHGGVVHRASEFVRHEKYEINKFGVPVYDIAIVKLKTSIAFNKVSQPVPLFKNDEIAKEDTISTISGWGATKEGGSPYSFLMAVDVPVINKADCNQSYKATHGDLPAGQICAAFPAGGKDTCQGDSGGPMIIDGRQAGVVSWGNGCARPGFPGVYTEVAYFRDWIKQHADV